MAMGMPKSIIPEKCWKCPCFQVATCPNCGRWDNEPDPFGGFGPMGCISDVGLPDCAAEKCGDTRNCLRAKVAHRQMLWEVLKTVEWILKYQGPFEEPDNQYRLCCPTCQRTKEEGHAPDCKVGKALGKEGVEQREQVKDGA